MNVPILASLKQNKGVGNENREELNKIQSHKQKRDVGYWEREKNDIKETIFTRRSSTIVCRRRLINNGIYDNLRQACAIWVLSVHDSD